MLQPLSLRRGQGCNLKVRSRRSNFAISDGTMVRATRVVLACLVALSVAILPAMSLTAVSAKSAEIIASADMSAAMDDCCPNHAKPCDQNADQCQSMAFCTHQTFSILNVAFSQFVYPSVVGDLLSTFAEQDAPLYSGCPPFRPPRV